MLHTMDQSWSNEDLNDDGPSFHKYLHMGPWWHDAPIKKLKQKKKKKKKTPCNFCMLDEKQKNVQIFLMNECKYCIWWTKCGWSKCKVMEE